MGGGDAPRDVGGRGRGRSGPGYETELAKLRLERDAARVRLDASSAVTESAAAFVDPLDQLLDLDAARDEIERARALADIYREEAAASSLADDELPPNRPKSR